MLGRAMSAMNSAFTTFRCSRHFLSFSSSSCFFFSDKFCSRRNRRVVPSTLSSPRSAGTTRRGVSPAECRTVRSLRFGPGSKRLPGRTTGSGGFCARRPSCCSCSTPSLVLVTVLSARRPSCAVSTFGYEWWDTVASTAATACCSCRNHERRRRCLRRFAAPSPSTIRGRQLDSAMKSQRTKCSQTCLSLVVVVVAGLQPKVSRSAYCGWGSDAAPNLEKQTTVGAGIQLRVCRDTQTRSTCQRRCGKMSARALVGVFDLTCASATSSSIWIRIDPVSCVRLGSGPSKSTLWIAATCTVSCAPSAVQTTLSLWRIWIHQALASSR